MNKIYYLIGICFSLTACGPSSMGLTVDEFNSKIEQLKGKSPVDVEKVLGKPPHSSTGGKTILCYEYEGVKDPSSGKLSIQSSVCFNNGVLAGNGAEPSHQF